MNDFLIDVHKYVSVLKCKICTYGANVINYHLDKSTVLRAIMNTTDISKFVHL